MPPKYNQHFRAEWESMTDFKEWLQPVESDTTKAYCKYCKSQIVAKYYCLKQHALSSKHLKSMEPLKGQKKNGISKKNTIFQTPCIIKNILAPHFYQELVDDIGDQEYSILIDESTDVSVSKLLGVTVRYYSLSLKKIVSTFLGLVELEDGTANGIVNGLKLLLSGLNLNIKNIIGIGTDNATVMTGTTNGVHQLLKTITGKDNLVLVRCVCHSLQLAMSHASDQTLPRNIDFLIRETYNWFSHSSKRQLYYKELYKTMNCGSEPLKIPRLCNTRWISIEPAVVRILDQWEELKLLFQVARSSEQCYMAEMLYNMYNDPVNHLYLIYIKPIVQEVQKVNKLFESNDVHKFYPQTCNRITIGLPTNFAVLRKMAMFSVQETLKVVKPPIVEIAQEFNIDATGIDKLIITQWRNIVFIKWHCTSSTAKFWCEELATFAITVLTLLPHSNADIERVFSQVNLVKTKLRNSLSISTLNAILYVRFGLKRVNKYCHSTRSLTKS
ncbi:hypothetical protein ABMA28_003497 [Loxostege sticticalis]|uniref:Transposase n=1 Tax=Loxostege sticticalis TaxID=481309 RepID=A0ABD0SWI6_LOXSC